MSEDTKTKTRKWELEDIEEIQAAKKKLEATRQVKINRPDPRKPRQRPTPSKKYGGLQLESSSGAKGRAKALKEMQEEEKEAREKHLYGGDMEPAGLVQRLVAVVIDGFLYTALTFGFGIVIGILTASGKLPIKMDSFEMEVIKWGYTILIVLMVFILPIAKSGRTPGKAIMRVRVVLQNSEEPIGITKAIVRETIGKFISLLILGGGFFMAFFNKKRLALHDVMVGSKVI